MAPSFHSLSLLFVLLWLLGTPIRQSLVEMRVGIIFIAAAGVVCRLGEHLP
jgi:hypothetical protein